METVEDNIDTPISEEDRKLLEQVYYKEGLTFGRDGLFQYLKSKYKKHPSRRVVMRWLKKQKLHQEFAPTRSAGLTDFFHPVAPFHSLSIDLIDYNNKPAQSNRKYILVVVDNFSRKMYCESITTKEPVKTTPAMEKILKQIFQEHKKTPKYIISDDGSEWKSIFDTMLKGYNIDRRRTLGGQPQANGLVERSNGKLKMLIAKNMKINGGSWYDNLSKSLNAYNNQYIRTTQYTPNQALELKGEDQKKLVNNVEDKHKIEVNNEKIVIRTDYKVGDKIRVKLNKGTMGKSSSPSWSSVIYTIGKVIKPKLPTISEKYKVKELAQDQLYSRGDLQLIEGTPENIPTYVKEKAKKQQTGQLNLTTGSFTIAEEEDKRRSRRDRKQTEQFDFTKAGLNDTALRKKTNVAETPKKKTKPLPTADLAKSKRTQQTTAVKSKQGRKLAL